MTLPSSLAAKPNIPWEKQTLAQLREERAYWDEKVRSAGSWGAHVRAARDFRAACDKWIATREAENAPQ